MPKSPDLLVQFELATFARNLKIARVEAGLKQADITDRCGVWQNYLSRLERALTSVGLDKMAELAQAIETPLYHLLDPRFQVKYEQAKSDWKSYSQHIDNSNDIPYERKLFVENFVHLRKSQNVSRQELFEMSGLSVIFIHHLENYLHGIKIENAARIANALGVTLAQLLTPRGQP